MSEISLSVTAPLPPTTSSSLRGRLGRWIRSLRHQKAGDVESNVQSVVADSKQQQQVKTEELVPLRKEKCEVHRRNYFVTGGGEIAVAERNLIAALNAQDLQWRVSGCHDAVMRIMSQATDRPDSHFPLLCEANPYWRMHAMLWLASSLVEKLYMSMEMVDRASLLFDVAIGSLSDQQAASMTCRHVSALSAAIVMYVAGMKIDDFEGATAAADVSADSRSSSSSSAEMGGGDDADDDAAHWQSRQLVIDYYQYLIDSGLGMRTHGIMTSTRWLVQVSYFCQLDHDDAADDAAAAAAAADLAILTEDDYAGLVNQMWAIYNDTASADVAADIVCKPWVRAMIVLALHYGDTNPAAMQRINRLWSHAVAAIPRQQQQVAVDMLQDPLVHSVRRQLSQIHQQLRVVVEGK